MIKLAIFHMLFTASQTALEEAPEAVVIPESTPKSEQCRDGLKDLRRSADGLEWFLLDKKVYRDICPEIDWEQPDIDEYRNEPRSYLPPECKRTDNED